MKTFKQIREMAGGVGGGGSAGPTNVVGTGEIAGTGSGPDPKKAEPGGTRGYMGFYRRKRKTLHAKAE